MTKIATRPPRSRAHPPGMDRFREIIARRLQHAEAGEPDVFGPGIQDKLLKFSGGQPRELMILIREALIGGDLPIADAAVDRPAREGTRAYARQLTEEHTAIIDQVCKNGTLRRTKDSDETVRELLDSRAVLQYVNEEEWYGVNPLIPQPPAPKRKSK